MPSIPTSGLIRASSRPLRFCTRCVQAQNFNATSTIMSSSNTITSTMDAYHNSRRLSILDMPEDILCEIFDYIDDRPNGIYNNRGTTSASTRIYPDKEYLETIQAARLVCRRFCQRASPLLAHGLDVRIDPESIGRFDQLTRNPHIAAGVRLVRFSLAYRPRDLAESPAQYRDLQLEMLDSLIRSCDWYTEFVNEVPEDELVGDEAEISEAMEKYFEIKDAWSNWPDARDSRRRPLTDAEKDRHGFLREFIAQAHEQYQQKHREQAELLTAGSLAKVLSRFMARLPSLSTLAFVAKPTISPSDFTGREELRILANDTEKLQQVMTAPQSWQVIEDLGPESDLRPAKLLWQLPMAMHAAGVHFANLSISPIPIKGNFDKLCPYTSPSEDEEDWESLETALQGLRTVSVDAGNCGVIRHEHMSAQNQHHVNNFISALSCSTALEEVSLGCYGLKLNSGRPSWTQADRRETPDMFNPGIGRVLATRTALWPRLKTLCVNHVTFTEDELVSFISGLGNRLEWAYLYSIGVAKGGGWSRPLDVFREKMKGLEPTKKHSVTLKSLCGGGFDIKAAQNRAQESSTEWIGGIAPWLAYSGEDPLCEAAVKYVRGEEDINPLVELEAGVIP